MNVQSQIKTYIAQLPESIGTDLQWLNQLIRKQFPECKQWFLDGRNSEGKIVSNPNIGYGTRVIKYADGKEKEFYQIGLSANTIGISVYILGLDDNKLLSEKFGKRIGKASVTGYCIKFRSLKDIKLEILEQAICLGMNRIS